MSDAVLPSPDNSGYVGSRRLEAGSSDFNAQAYLIEQMLNGRLSVATVVKVMAVTNAGGITASGTVDVLPLVNQIDGLKNATPHLTIYGVPYSRLQGGANAIIIDPQVGDIGIALFADHDISTVKATKAQSNPGSFRHFDMADGLYIGWILNGVPTQYIGYSAAGIEVVSPVQVTITAPLVLVNSDMHVTGAVIAGFGGAGQVGLQTHAHAQDDDSNGDMEAPTDAPMAGS